MKKILICGIILVAVFAARQGTGKSGPREALSVPFVEGRGKLPPNFPVCEPNEDPEDDANGQG